MKQKNKSWHFIFTLFICSFLIIIISENSRDFQQGSFNSCFGHSYKFDIISAESSLLSDNTRITVCDIPTGANDPVFSVYCIFGGSFVLSAAVIFLSLIDKMSAKGGIAHKSMIKYIHDQHGQSVDERYVFYKI